MASVPWNLVLVAVVAGAVLAFAAAEPDVEPRRLSAIDFNDAVRKKKHSVLVNFCVSWSEHCERMNSVWAGVATAVSHSPLQGAGVIVATVSCESDRDICERYGINAFPAIRLFTKGDDKHPLVYEGSRDVNSVYRWLEGHRS